MDERTDPWTDTWQGDPLLAFVEQQDVAVSDQGSPHSKVWVLDVVREKDVSFLLGGGRGARTELSFAATAQVVMTLPLPPPHDLDAFEEGTWQRIGLGDPAGFPAVLYRDLDGAESVPTKLSVGARLDPQHAAGLVSLVSTDDAPEATTTDIDSLVATPTCEFVNVMHVGQGNCNVLCDEDGLALIYFDLGAGCLQNTRTRPANLEFCFTAHPSVVLSHWDFDHWYGASVSPAEARAQPNWIAPQQAIGVRTRKFAASLINQNRLWRWPAGRQTAVGTGIELVRCTGTTKNDSGIALAARTQKGIVLCPGDAAFDYLPVPKLVGGQPLAGLVATHHGSGHAGTPVPRPAPHGVLAFSFGAGNTFRHPAASRSLYAGEGWLRQLDTPNGGVALGGPARPPPCGAANCTLTTTQS